MKIQIEIENCSKCPNFKEERVYTADSFENVHKWMCNAKDGKVIHGYVDWDEYDKKPIPTWCPCKVTTKKKTTSTLNKSIPKKIDKDQALNEAAKMLEKPMNQLPLIALEYLKDMSRRVGFCGEVCLTAYAYYNQAVLDMPCSDELYTITIKELEWFVEKNYASEKMKKKYNKVFEK